MANLSTSTLSNSQKKDILDIIEERIDTLSELQTLSSLETGALAVRVFNSNALSNQIRRDLSLGKPIITDPEIIVIIDKVLQDFIRDRKEQKGVDQAAKDLRGQGASDIRSSSLGVINAGALGAGLALTSEGLTKFGLTKGIASSIGTAYNSTTKAGASAILSAIGTVPGITQSVIKSKFSLLGLSLGLEVGASVASRKVIKALGREGIEAGLEEIVLGAFTVNDTVATVADVAITGMSLFNPALSLQGRLLRGMGSLLLTQIIADLSGVIDEISNAADLAFGGQQTEEKESRLSNLIPELIRGSPSISNTDAWIGGVGGEDLWEFQTVGVLAPILLTATIFTLGRSVAGSSLFRSVSKAAAPQLKKVAKSLNETLLAA